MFKNPPKRWGKVGGNKRGQPKKLGTAMVAPTGRNKRKEETKAMKVQNHAGKRRIALGLGKR